jgi:CheY-like chemotaxis protein
MPSHVQSVRCSAVDGTAEPKKAGVPNRVLLIVDDDRDLRELLREVLEEEGYSVALAKNGADALRQIRDGLAPDALFVDLTMPDTNRLQLCDHWSTDSRLNGVPLFIMSGIGERDDFKARCSPTEFLQKPITLDTLLDTLKRHFR